MQSSLHLDTVADIRMQYGRMLRPIVVIGDGRITCLIQTP